MDKARTDGPVLVWETLNTRREEDGILDSKYLTERAKGPGGWAGGRFSMWSRRAAFASGLVNGCRAQRP